MTRSSPYDFQDGFIAKSLLKFNYIFFLIGLSSCTSFKLIIDDEAFINSDKVTVHVAEQIENLKGSARVMVKRDISLGSSIYPNAHMYDLASPLTFEKRTGGLKVKTEYFFDRKDSIVRVVFYQWDKIDKRDRKSWFYNQFDNLSSKISKKLGGPMDIETNRKAYNDKTFRDALRWRGGEGKFNAYLFMFGNDQHGFRQIRLAIYWDSR